MSRITEAIVNSEFLSYAIIVALGLVIGFLVIVLRWVVLGRRDARRLGYRVIWTGPGQYVYEERNAERPFAQPPFWREWLWATGVGWPAPRPAESNRQLAFRCTEVGLRRMMHLPNASQWNDSVEEWARNRRNEIALRIKNEMVETFGSANVLESDKPDEPV